MSSVVNKVKLINYKRFKKYALEPNQRISVLVGDNEVGKSSILEAIDLVSCGNVRRVEALGVDRLLNVDAVQEFNDGDRSFGNLPKLIVELYLDGNFDHTMNGENNTDEIVCDGIRLVCEPNFDYQTEIAEAMQECADYFPYDYYSIRFSTFADEGYTGYKKKLRSIFIDSTQMSSDYATNDFIRRMYSQFTEDDIKERAVHKGKYRQMKNGFRAESLQKLNNRISIEKNYAFGLKPSSIASLESDLMIFEGEIGIDSKGTGKQVFIKTDFALERSGTNIDVVLIEEPENHLSHINLRKLVERVSATQEGQIFITTHNSLISTRLELQNLLIMHEEACEKPTSLKELTEETAKYFMKAPVANIIEYSISRRVVLVEGPSEYMLFERFYETVAGNKPENDDVHIIDVRGLSFKRYLEIAQLLGSKVAVVTDNDGDKQRKCVDKYSEYAGYGNIRVFYDEDDKKKTFEIVLYEENKNLCDQLFGVDAEAYMLKNKTEAAYSLICQNESIAVPLYIKEAIEWIKE